MDALDLKDLARLGLAGSGLRDVLLAPIPRQSLELCRTVSEANGRLPAAWQATGAEAASAQVALGVQEALVLELSEELAAWKEDFAELRKRRLEERDAWQQRVRALEHELASVKRSRTN